MTPRPDERVPLRWPWPWIATLVGIALFFGLLISVALHVQRSAELEIAQHQRELGALQQRSLEIELETERILQAGTAAKSRATDGGAAEASVPRRPALTLLRGTAASHSQAYGAVAWHADLAQGQLRLAGLPPQPQPHTYELWQGEQPVPGSRFSAPAGGEVQVTLTTADGWERASPGPLTLRLSHGRDQGDTHEAVIVLQEP